MTDDINGTALTYNKDVSYKSLKGATAEMKAKGNGFTATIPSMSDGEQVTFTYTASVDLDELEQSGTVDQDKTSNGVNITCPDDKNQGDNSATQFVNYISFSSLGKNAQSVGNTYPENGKTYRNITWTINANQEQKKHITYISDSINSDSQGIMTYSGDGLTIVVTKEDGTTETRNVPWNDIQKTNTGWKYTPPASDGKASYQVTYTTKADVTNLITSRNVSNSARTDYNSTTGNASVGPSSENAFSASKSVTQLAEDRTKTTWTITVNVPAKGLDKLVVTDTLPTIYVDNNQKFSDSFDQILSVEGRDDEEQYTVDTSDPTKFIMTFYKDKNRTKPGMNNSSGNRTITIRYTTNNDKDWLAYSAKNPNYEYPWHHTNSAVISAPEVEQSVSADAIYNPSEMTVKKTGTLTDQTTIMDNQKWQIIGYDIVLSNATDNQTLTDTFDTTHLKYFDGHYVNAGGGTWYDSSAGAIYGGTKDWQGTSGGSGFTVTQTENGLTFHTGILPRQWNGTLFPYYKIHYYLRVKVSDMEQLAVKNGGTAKFTNSVKWGTKGASADVYYPYPGVSKQCNMNGTTATYTISVNPSALELNGGKTMDLVDTFSNQAVDYSTIAVTATDSTGNDRQGEVTYKFSGNTGTFKIPDSTHVTITYQARPVGKAGSTVTMTNAADMKTYHSETSNRVTIDGSASGGGSITSLKLMKYAANHMETKLAGAVFQLCDEHGTALKYDRGNKFGQEITFRTDKDGYAYIKLSVNEEYSQGLDFGKLYKLKEIEAPKGYQVVEGYIPFKISDDGSIDPKTNLYANGGTLPVEDKKITEVSITLKKVDSGNTANTLSGAVFNLYGSDYINSDGSVNASANPINKSRLETGAGGTVSLGTLKSGTYYLVETTAPDGYTKETEPITVTVADNGVTVKQGTSISTSDINDDTSGQAATITVTNSAGYVLPSTGGPGSRQWQEMGMFLLLAGAVLISGKLLASEKREGGEL